MLELHDVSGQVNSPETVELAPDQAALIPKVGDEYFVPGFSIEVRRRAFEAKNDAMYVTLYD